MAKSSADGIRWDLGDLYSSISDPKIEADLKMAKEKARLFESRYKPAFQELLRNMSSFPRKRESRDVDPRFRGNDEKKIALVDVFDLEEVLRAYIDIVELSTRPSVYASLLFSSDTKKPEHGAFIQKMRTRATEIRAHCLFWEIIWSRLDPSVADALSKCQALQPYEHYLKKLRSFAPHVLEEGEEKAIDIKENTGSRAFSRLFDEVVNNITFRVNVNGKIEEKTESEALALLHSSDRALRREGHRSLTEGFKENARILTYIFNMILEDHRASAKLRKYDHPMAGRNLDNEITLAAVENLIRSAKSAYPTVERYYRLKRKILQLDKLYDYDRYAPISERDPHCEYQRGREIVRTAYHQFHPDVGRIIDQFFTKKWIDAELRPGKHGGAFSCETLPSLHPYILTNYADRVRDVMTLAHELGHGVHQYLARPVGVLESHAPLTLAECASVFGEMLVFDKWMEQEKDEEVKLALLSSKIEDCFATVFRQIVMTDFELKIHFAVAENGELTTEKFCDLWMEANRPMHGAAVTLTEEYRYWWIYIPHFIHTPFYCYAYAFAQLLVLALYEKYKLDRDRFVPGYTKLLSLGGSRTPEELCRLVGIDISDPEFWNLGLSLVSKMVDQAEQLAAKHV
ncbi:MAG: M3 family oligoendopeptidase [Candidatus Omnitrophica bacterium]|nr:M3 family oligoendopeptidase [Candidatus Omnitrophota bacterium]